jgi:hypothetical protein
VLDRPAQHRRRGASALVAVLLDVGVAGAVVDYAVQVDVAPACALLGAGLVADAGDRMPGALKARQAGDVDVQQGTGARPLIAAVALPPACRSVEEPAFFTSQYFQLVLGFSALESGLWSLPGLLAMIVVSSAIVPRLATRVRPGYLVAGGMATCAVGFALFTQLDANDGLALLVAANTIISIGIAPASTLGTNLIVGSAPAGSGGAASGVAQTGNELGGALGIALLGTLGHGDLPQ